MQITKSLQIINIKFFRIFFLEFFEREVRKGYSDRDSRKIPMIQMVSPISKNIVERKFRQIRNSALGLVRLNAFFSLFCRILGIFSDHLDTSAIHPSLLSRLLLRKHMLLHYFLQFSLFCTRFPCEFFIFRFQLVAL